MRAPYVGRSILRREDPRLISGRGRFLDDLPNSNTHHAVFVRSVHARGRVARIESARARTMPGVTAVLGAHELGARVQPIRSTIDADDYAPVDRPLLCTDICAVGEPLAVVVARRTDEAIDAAEQVEIEYEVMPAVTTLDAALAPEAPRVHPGVSGNVLWRSRHTFGDVEDVFARAEVVIRGRFRSGRVTAVPLEGRGCLVVPDPGRGTLDIWVSTQAPHSFRTAVAECLGLPESSITVHVPDIGGAFGIKIPVYPEEVVVAYLASTLGVPVKWVQRRSEDLQSNAQCRDQVYELELAARTDGSFVGLRARILTDSGSYALPPHGAILQPHGAARALPGPYRFAAYSYESIAVTTNTSPSGAYRGVSQPTAVFARERTIDLLARRLGRDPVELRFQNLLSPEESERGAINGVKFEDTSFRQSLELALEQAGYAEFRRDRASGAQKDVGMGVSLYTEATGLGTVNWRRAGMTDIPGYDAALVRVLPDGTVEMASSIPSIGQGHETAMAQLVADELGVSIDTVRVLATETRTAPYGTGVFASRGVIAGGGATLTAARTVKEQVRRVAAGLLECAAEDVVLEEGRVFPVGAPARSVALSQVARAAYGLAGSASPTPAAPGLEATAAYDPPPVTFANGCHVATVRVDRDTGRVEILNYVVAHDCGVVINPAIVDGQVQGGVVQGLGNTMNEALLYDDTGQLLTGTLMDYPVPRATDAPPLTLIHLDSRSRATLGGFKGTGENGIIGVPAAVANAVADALPEIAAEIKDLPLTSERIWQLLHRV